jgi:hypothetical protein
MHNAVSNHTFILIFINDNTNIIIIPKAINVILVGSCKLGKDDNAAKIVRINGVDI